MTITPTLARAYELWTYANNRARLVYEKHPSETSLLRCRGHGRCPCPVAPAITARRDGTRKPAPHPNTTEEARA